MFFKSLLSKNQKTDGDKIWISQCGNISVLIDAASFTKNPLNTVREIINYLNKIENNIVKNSSKFILENLNNYLYYKNDDLIASICIIKKEKNSFLLSSIGNSQVLKINKNSSSFILEPVYQPSKLVGLKNNIQVKEEKISIEDDTTYVLSSDGINLNKLTFEEMDSFISDKDWINYISDNKKEDDWSLCTFPYEKQFSYENIEWPYFPFMGKQEDYEHEKSGLSKLADRLFEDKSFDGFKIVSGPEIICGNSFRKFDGILVSPYGVVLLELKDWRGEIFIPFDGANMSANDNGERISETSPIKKINKVMDDFTAFSAFNGLHLPTIRMAAIIFTNSLSTIKCIDNSGNKITSGCKAGYILISSVKNFSTDLKRYWKNNISMGKKGKFSNEKINTICNELLSCASNLDSSNSNDQVLKNRYKFSSDSLDTNLSTEYYKLFNGIDKRKNKPVLIKEYELTSISKGSLEQEAIRISREVEALKDLQKNNSTQYFLDEDRINTKLYVVLEYVEGKTLDEYLKNNISQIDKLSLIYKIVEILQFLDDENIIHRAINPKNIIINNNIPVLTNFELCKLEFLPTLPPRGRRLLDSSYEAREVNSCSSSSISISSDIFSVGKLICLILSGKLPFNNSNEKRKFSKNKKCWTNLAIECNLNNYAGKQLQSILSDDPTSRPTINELLNIIKKWEEDIAK